MKKKIETWLKELPDGYRELALENYKKAPSSKDKHTSLSNAIYWAFVWHKTPEGHAWWSSVVDWVEFQENPPKGPKLPALPKKKPVNTDSKSIEKKSNQSKKTK